MANLLNSTVMTAMMDAASHAKVNQYCTGLASRYRDDEGAAQRAMGYASDAGQKAMSASEQAGEALTERVKEVREEERLEQAQLLEATRAENRVENLAVQVDNGIDASPADRAPQPAAILELSQEYLDSVQAGATADTAPVANPATATDSPTRQPAASLPNERISAPQTKSAAGATAGRRGFSMDRRV